MISLFAADTETDLTLETIIARDHWDIALRVGVLLLIALPACFIVSRMIGRISRRRIGDHVGILIQKILL
jgi:hypothetical protein